MQLSYRVGKTRAIQIALGYGILVQSGLFLVADPGNIPMFWGYTFFYGIAYGAVPPILRINDGRRYGYIDELQSGKKRAGMFLRASHHRK